MGDWRSLIKVTIEGIKEYTELKHVHVDEILDRKKKFWYNVTVPMD